jgi:hypothetical protein
MQCALPPQITDANRGRRANPLCPFAPFRGYHHLLNQINYCDINLLAHTR